VKTRKLQHTQLRGRYGGAGFIGSHLCERLLDLVRSAVRGQFFTAPGTILHICLAPAVRANASRFTFPPTSEATESISSLSRSTYSLPVRPGPTTKTRRSRRDQHAWARQAPACKDTQASTSECTGIPMFTSTRKLLGHVNPIGLRSCYDEGSAAPRRIFRLPPKSQVADKNRAHLQYLWAANAS